MVLLTHGESVDKVAEGLRCVASQNLHIISTIADTERRFNGVQFDPEVDLTENGRKMLHNFLFDICGLQGGFTMEKREQQYIDYVRHTVGRNKIDSDRTLDHPTVAPQVNPTPAPPQVPVCQFESFTPKNCSWKLISVRRES
ncbi:hypothetical protein OUZ56_026867 [Daphnia magna]|uniref:Glutamine amidotransferase domain-containing protein n=1 Tax=Daphnia magna TaxID=35525 RepID=A0ABQ9ZN84_9CRUS|nr:hypothetical protein OUZ56_026867 [Daphnia magna]